MRGSAGLALVILAIVVIVAVLVLNDGGSIGSLSPDQFASVGYLSVIAAVLGGSVLFAARQNLPAALKAVGFWALVFVALIGGYAFRDELREVGDRMLAEVMPGHAIAVADSGGRTVLVARSEDRHFHVDAKVDGASVRFLVDTGASLVAFDRATAARLGYDVSDAAFTERVETANGVARAAPVTVSLIKIGGIERRNVRASVMEDERGGISLLGMSFLGTLSSFEFQGARLVLAD